MDFSKRGGDRPQEWRINNNLAKTIRAKIFPGGNEVHQGLGEVATLGVRGRSPPDAREVFKKILKAMKILQFWQFYWKFWQFFNNIEVLSNFSRKCGQKIRKISGFTFVWWFGGEALKQAKVLKTYSKNSMETCNFYNFKGNFAIFSKIF